MSDYQSLKFAEIPSVLPEKKYAGRQYNKHDSLYFVNDKQDYANNKQQEIPNFAERLSDLLVEKTTLNIDYQAIFQDLNQFGFKLKPTSPDDYNPSLDIVRLKAGLHVMDLCFKDMINGNCDIEESQKYFKDEVSKVAEILIRDFKRLNDSFKNKLSDRNQINIDELEAKFYKHIDFYNHFSGLMNDYLELIHQDDASSQ